MRIIAAELPRHRDHLAVALVVSLVLALAGAFAIVMLPAPKDNVRYLEAARTIRTRAFVERERRHAFAPIALPLAPARVARTHSRPLQPSDDDLIGEGYDDGLDREDDRVRELSRERQRREQEERERRWAASDAPELAPHALDDGAVDALGAEVPPLPLVPLPRSALREPEHICRLPDRDAVRAWFEEKVRPVLQECLSSHTPASEVRGSVTIVFDEKGRVEGARIADVDAAFSTCAQPKLMALAHPEAFALTFTWPFVLLP